MRSLIHKIHLYLSILSGFFILLIAISGVIYVFNDEIIYFIDKDAITIPTSQKSRLDIDTILERVEENNYKPVQFDYSAGSDKSITVLAKDMDDKFVQLYINPYTGAIIKASGLYAFFNFIESFHTELCMGAPGRAFIGIITIFFLILLITGVFLWYPKKWNKKTAKNSFILKMKGSSFVVNYNLHKILGFYIIIPSVILCITGIIMAFDSLEINILNAIGADGDYESYIEEKIAQPLSDNASVISYEQLIQSHINRFGKIDDIRVSIPETTNTGFVLFETGNDWGMKYADNYTFSYLNLSNGDILSLTQSTITSLNIKREISQLHTGKLLGITYKIILFFTGLILFSLPITGFFMWYKKKNKRKI